MDVGSSLKPVVASAMTLQHHTGSAQVYPQNPKIHPRPAEAYHGKRTHIMHIHSTSRCAKTLCIHLIQMWDLCVCVCVCSGHRFQEGVLSHAIPIASSPPRWHPLHTLRFIVLPPSVPCGSGACRRGFPRDRSISVLGLRGSCIAVPSMYQDALCERYCPSRQYKGQSLVSH